MEKLGELLEAPAEFCMAISYNPGYQSVLKDLKQSTTKTLEQNIALQIVKIQQSLN